MRARTHRPWKAAGLAALVLLLPLGAPSSASAAKVVSAKAVINACGGDSLAMTARAKPKKRVRGRRTRRRLRRFKRRTRGSRLEVQFRAVALFGSERRSPWKKADRGGRASHAFSGLPADSWSGFVKFRWRKRGRTRGSSFVNSSNGKVGGRRGRSLCSLGVGVPPRDTTAPFVLLHPDDSTWRRPFTATMFAKDDFSGVAATEYRVNGGGLRRGPNVVLGSHGVHNVDYRAVDAAGNASAFKRAVLRVDTQAPSAPVVDAAKFNPSGNPRPTIRWSRSSDSGSGVDRYIVQARRGSAVVAERVVNATGAAHQAVTLPTLHSGAASVSYSIRVTAVDNVERTTASSPQTFNIDTRPQFSEEFTDGDCVGWNETPAGGQPNAFTCVNRDLRSVNVERAGANCGIFGCSPGADRTWTITRTFNINAQAGQRFGATVFRSVNLPATSDVAAGAVKIDGDTVLFFGGRQIAARTDTGVSQALTAGAHAVEVKFVLTIAGREGDPNAQVFDPSFVVDNIFVGAVD